MTRQTDGVWGSVVKNVWLIAAALAIVAWSPFAQAQEASGVGGVRVGNGRLHPYVRSGSTYITNPALLPQANTYDMVLNVTPGIDLDLPSNSSDLRLSAGGSYKKYLGVDDPNTERLTAFEPSAGFAAHLFKEGGVGARLNGSYRLVSTAASRLEIQRLRHHLLQGGVGLDFKPGGGALVLSPNYAVRYDRYIEGVDTRELTHVRHEPSLRFSWKFFPKTSAFIESRAMLTRYPEATINRGTDFYGGLIGLYGQVTRRVSTKAQVGYNYVNSQGKKPMPVMGDLAVGYGYHATRLEVGVGRNFYPTSVYQHYSNLRTYLRFLQSIAQVKLDTKIAYGRYEFGDPLTTGLEDSRLDQRVSFNFRIIYPVTPWILLSVADNLEVLRTNAGTSIQVVTGTGETITDTLAGNYTTNSVSLLLELRY